jgi:iron(III) transport system substrate-binding protein
LPFCGILVGIAQTNCKCERFALLLTLESKIFHFNKDLAVMTNYTIQKPLNQTLLEKPIFLSKVIAKTSLGALAFASVFGICSSTGALAQAPSPQSQSSQAAAGSPPGKELNLYSARHYQTDEALYKDFTAATGIKVNLLEAGDEALLERLRSEGKSSKADVVLMVDAARLWRAQIDGLFQPVNSAILKKRIPAQLQGKDDGQGAQWFGFSTRARVLVVNKTAVNPNQIQTYEDLAKPEFKGKVCTRSGSHPYMLSWIGAMSEHLGEAKTLQWATDVVANFARKPRGGDTDQIKAVASGECAIAVTNTYYLVRLMRSDKAEDKAIMQNIQVIWPNQKTTGTHFNIAGGAVAKNAPNREGAVKFLEYLASDSAQRYFAEGNNEWPSVAGLKVNNAALYSLGEYKADATPISNIGRAQVLAQRIVDKAGWR